MRVVLAVLALLVAAQPAAGVPPSAGLPPGDELYERPRVGLSAIVPAGWTIVREPLSYCTDPVQRIALRRGRAVVQIVESLSGGVTGFPLRPKRFELAGGPEYLACCPPADGKGWFLAFRDGGRGFYAYVYVGAQGTGADALRILDSFRVRQAT